MTKATSSIYDILMALPPLRGASRECISEILGKVKFHFLKYPAGTTIVEAGEECTSIRFVISGSVRTSLSNSDGRFRITQRLDAPDVIGPEFLMGLNTRYPYSIIAHTDAGIMQMTKADYLDILCVDKVFLINYLNTLAHAAQKSMNGLLTMTGGSLENRIAYWIVLLTQGRASEITIHAKQRDLYTMFGVQRSSFISAMQSLQSQGLIQQSPAGNAIHITDRRGLLDILEVPTEWREPKDPD